MQLHKCKNASSSRIKLQLLYQINISKVWKLFFFKFKILHKPSWHISSFCECLLLPTFLNSTGATFLLCLSRFLDVFFCNLWLLFQFLTDQKHLLKTYLSKYCNLHDVVNKKQVSNFKGFAGSSQTSGFKVVAAVLNQMPNNCL